MKLLTKLITLLLFAFTFSSLSAIDPKKIVGGKINRTFPTSANTFKSPVSSGKSKDIMSLYRGSHHERALDAQIRNYRASAKRNEEVFGRGFRNSSTQTKYSQPKAPSDRIVIYNNKKFRVTVGSGGNLNLIPLK